MSQQKALDALERHVLALAKALRGRPEVRHVEGAIKALQEIRESGTVKA